MKTIPQDTKGHRLVLQGLHLWLTDAMRSSVTRKAERLFRHEPRIIRVRIGIDCEHRRNGPFFSARGLVEIRGADLAASVSNSNAYRAVDRLVQKLDRMLRRRATAIRRGRTGDDIRAHAEGA